LAKHSTTDQWNRFAAVRRACYGELRLRKTKSCSSTFSPPLGKRRVGPAELGRAGSADAHRKVRSAALQATGWASKPRSGEVQPTHTKCRRGLDGGGALERCTTCEELGVESFAYLREVLARVKTRPNSQIEELLPDRWASRESPDAM
jgi:hypothetical protein